MKVKDLIANLSKCDQEMDIILEPVIDHTDDTSSCYLPGDIIDGNLPELGLRYEIVQLGDDDGDECAYFGDEFEDPILVKKVVVLSSTQFKYGSGEDNISPPGLRRQID
jgi:hypothetical protein